MIFSLFFCFTISFLNENIVGKEGKSYSAEINKINKNSINNYVLNELSKSKIDLQSVDFISKLNAHIDINSYNDNIIEIKKETWKKSHESFATEKVFVKSSNFINCRFPDAQGGAIISLTFIYIEDSIFSKCFAKSGGSICAMFDLTTINTKFVDSFAKRGGSVHHQYGTCKFNDTLFASSASTVFGGSFYSTESQMHISTNTNYSSSSCKEDASAAYIERTDVNILYNIVSNCHLKRGTGGFLLKQTEGEVSNSIFCNNCFDDIVGGGASSIEISGSREMVSIETCHFYKSSAFNYWSIRGRFQLHATINNCYFSNTKEMEISLDKAKITNCFFEQKKFLVKIPKNNYKYQEPVDKPEVYRMYARFFAYFGKFILPFIIIILFIHEVIDSLRMMKMKKKNIE